MKQFKQISLLIAFKIMRMCRKGRAGSIIWSAKSELIISNLCCCFFFFLDIHCKSGLHNFSQQILDVELYTTCVQIVLISISLHMLFALCFDPSCFWGIYHKTLKTLSFIFHLIFSCTLTLSFIFHLIFSCTLTLFTLDQYSLKLLIDSRFCVFLPHTVARVDTELPTWRRVENHTHHCRSW